MGFTSDILSANTISGGTFYGDGSNLTGISGGSGYQYYTAVTITSGQILTLNSNPTEVLPTLTGNKYYDFKVYFEYNFGTTPYTTAGAAPPRLINTSGNTIVAFYTIGSAFENFSMVAYQQGGINGLGNINSNIRLFQPAADPTVGDGTIKLKIYYNIVDFG